MDLGTYQAWLGKKEEQTQAVDPWPVRGLLAALDESPLVQSGDLAPLLSHWLYFGPTVPQSLIAEDGHPERGGFLPPVALPRRMWASSDIVFRRRMTIGEAVRKTARIADISLKEGGSGPLVFVKVANSYATETGEELLLEETQTLVYRDQPKADEPSPPAKRAPAAADWSERVRTDEAMLFRYSAVTFNAHRIHYDRPYTIDVEGYPNVVVQGQLTATLMLRALVRAHPDRTVNSFSFRGVKPLFCGESFHVEGVATDTGRMELWARDDDGIIRMSGRAEL